MVVWVKQLVQIRRVICDEKSSHKAIRILNNELVNVGILVVTKKNHVWIPHFTNTNI
jgi:hypothetical protein